MRKIDDDMFLKLNKIFTSDGIDKETKKELTKLKKIYVNNLNLDNIKEIEKKIYNNKTDEEKIVFELTRIKLKLFGNPRTENEIVCRLLNYLEKIIQLKGVNDEKKDENLLKSIVKIELDLGMDVGLLESFNAYFEDEVNRYLDIVNNYEEEKIEKKSMRR